MALCSNSNHRSFFIPSLSTAFSTGITLLTLLTLIFHNEVKNKLTEETAYASNMVNVSVNEARVESSRTERLGQSIKKNIP